MNTIPKIKLEHLQEFPMAELVTDAEDQKSIYEVSLILWIKGLFKTKSQIYGHESLRRYRREKAAADCRNYFNVRFF